MISAHLKETKIQKAKTPQPQWQTKYKASFISGKGDLCR